MKKFSVTLYRSRGFTLLEVLISILVFTVGLLGLASLQMFSLRVTGDSLTRTLAAVMANDMVDRMRANAAETTLGVNSAYNNPSGAATANTSCLGMNGAGAYTNTQCTPAQMAQQDFYEWYANMAGKTATSWHPKITAALPQGQGIVCIDSTPNDGAGGAPNCDNQLINGKAVYAVKIWWVERKDQNSPGTTHRYVTSFSL